MNLILRSLTALAAPAGLKSKLSVFYFHRVLEKPDPLLPYEPDARRFDRILGWIGSQFRVLDPVEACNRLYDGSLPSRPAVVTFDDGYRDNYTVALPILQRHGVKAAFFVATGFLNGGMMFNDRVIEAVRNAPPDSLTMPGTSERWPLKSLPDRQEAINRVLKAIKHLSPYDRDQRVRVLESELGKHSGPRMMMNPDEVAKLHQAGMRIGGHSRTHPILRALSDDDALAEICGGRDDIEAITGSRPELFAYPNGRYGEDFDDSHAQMVLNSGFHFAFSTHAGVATRASSRAMLPRFTPWDRSQWRFQLRALRNAVAGR